MNSTVAPPLTPSSVSVNVPPTSIDSSSPVVPSSSPPPSTPNSPPPTSTLPPTTPPSSAAPVSVPPSSTTEATVITSIVVQSPSSSGGTVVTVVHTLTSNAVVAPTQAPTSASSAPAAATTAAGALSPNTNDQSNSGGFTQQGKIAVAVVVPVVAVALLVLAGLFFWRKRTQRKDAEELRKKEMEEYTYNPNNDPTIPAIGGMSASGDESTLRDRDEGYRGWGTTSTARKASTTMSGGVTRSDSGGNGYTGQHSPTNGTANNSDVNSGDPLVDRTSANSETIGALGGAPVAANRTGGGVNRGPSNASSSYSGANRSDTSGEGQIPNTMGSPQYYNELMYHDDNVAHGAHADGGWGAGQPVIRDVQARRNTRIENPSVVPQQGNAGISQNF